MNRTLVALGALLGVLVSGCTTAGGPAADANGVKPATLRGQTDAWRYYTQGEPRVRIVAVDNQEPAPFAFRAPVAPGRRLVTVNIVALPLANLTATAAEEFQAGRQYQMTARRAGSGFDLLLWDESSGADKPTLLATARVGEKYANCTAADSATVRGTPADSRRFRLQGEPIVRITAVGGQKVAGGWGHQPDLLVTPGKNLVTVDIDARSGGRASGTVELEFAPQKTYCLSALQTGDHFDLLCWVVLPDLQARALVASRELKGWQDSGDGSLLLSLIRIK